MQVYKLTGNGEVENSKWCGYSLWSCVVGIASGAFLCDDTSRAKVSVTIVGSYFYSFVVGF